ncbi:hypothetical protein AB3A96_003512 [Vibrio vulnificus]
MALQIYSQQMAKLALYRQALPPPNSPITLPCSELSSYVRIGGQLVAEQSALNLCILHQFTKHNPANDDCYHNNVTDYAL